MPEQICDVCGKPVVVEEDATWLDAIAYKNPGYVMMTESRHVRCSPSRAQYITASEFGEPVVDDRPDFDKRLQVAAGVKSLETLYTNAWIKLQAITRNRVE